MKYLELRMAGAGGHGIVFAGRLLGHALTMANYIVTLRPHYSPAQRGGWSKVDMVVSRSIDVPPVLEAPHIFVVTLQSLYEDEIQNVASGGFVLFDEETVKPEPTRSDVEYLPLPLFKLSQQITGNRRFANSVLVGILAAATKLVSLEHLVNALDLVGARNIEENRKALEAGYRYAEEHGISIPVSKFMD